MMNKFINSSKFGDELLFISNLAPLEREEPGDAVDEGHEVDHAGRGAGRVDRQHLTQICPLLHRVRHAAGCRAGGAAGVAASGAAPPPRARGFLH